MSDDNTRLNSGDLDKTDLGQDTGPAPAARRPHRATDGSRGGVPGAEAPRREPTQVSAREVRASTETDSERTARETQAEERARRKREREQKEKQLAANKVKELVDSKINPFMAVVARNVLMVPPEVDMWMTVPVNEDTGEIIVDSRGIPRYQYSPAAQLAILQPYEVEILTMIAPSLANEELTAKAEAFGKKAGPYIAVGAGLAFAATYAMRMRMLKAGIDQAIEAHNARAAAENGE